VIIENAKGLRPGDMVRVTVTGSGEYDLFAVQVTATKDAPRATEAALHL
jgi:hypothetical protein